MLAAPVLVIALAQQPAPSIREVLPSGLRDATFTAVAVEANQRELRKINPDFAASYRALGNSARVSIKEPFKVRVQGREGDTEIIYVMNGPRRMIRIPRTGLATRQDLSKAPGKRQTIFDFGLIAPSLFDELFDARFVRRDRQTGDLVFDLTYKPELGDKTRNRIWVDPEKRIVRRREWYSQIDGRLMATFVFDQERRLGGIWIPGRMTVRNADNVVAGVMEYRDPSVNTGLDDSLFAVD